MDRKRLAEIRKGAAPGPGNRGLTHYATEVRELLAALDKSEEERDEWKAGCEKQAIVRKEAEAENARLKEALEKIARAYIRNGAKGYPLPSEVKTAFDLISPTQPAPAGECRNPYCDEAALCCKAAKETP